MYTNSEYKNKLQQLYKYQVWYFKILGLVPIPEKITAIKKLSYLTYSIAIVILVLMYELALLIAFFIQPTILDKITKVLYSLAALIGAVGKFFGLKVNYTAFQESIAFLYNDIFTPTDEKECAIFERNVAKIKFVRKVYCYGLLSGVIYVLFSKKVTAPNEQSIVIYTPFEINTAFVFILMETYYFAFVSSMCCLNIAFDTLCMTFFIFIKSELEILGHRLEKIGEDDENQLAITKKLIKCIYHHQEICSFVKAIERGVCIPISIQIISSVSVLCSNFYAMSYISFTDDTSVFMKFLHYQLCMLLQIFLICYFVNEMTLENQNLAHALYSADWIKWNKTNRKLALLAMNKFQIPIYVRSINRCYRFDLAAFTTVINSSYALLRQLSN